MAGAQEFEIILGNIRENFISISQSNNKINGKSVALEALSKDQILLFI